MGAAVTATICAARYGRVREAADECLQQCHPLHTQQSCCQKSSSVGCSAAGIRINNFRLLQFTDGRGAEGDTAQHSTAGDPPRQLVRKGTFDTIA